MSKLCCLAVPPGPSTLTMLHSDPDSAADALRGSVRKKLRDSRPQPAEFVSLHPGGQYSVQGTLTWPQSFYVARSSY